MVKFLSSISRNRRVLILLAVSAALVFINIGSTREFHCDDEYLYIRIAAEMFARGDIWVPTWFGAHAFYKPPFTYWMMMASFVPAGVSLVAARASVALISLLTVLLVYLLGRKAFGDDEGYCAALLTATSLGYLIYGRLGMLDFPLVFFMTLSVYLLYRAHSESSSTLAALFFVSAGASVLVKGPVSLVILGFVAIAFLALFGGWGRIFSRRASWGMLLGLAAAASWPLAMYAGGLWQEWYDFFVIRENFGKFADRRYPVMELVPYYLQYFFPWSAALVAVLPLVFRNRALRSPGVAILLLWILGVTAVYLLPATKLKHYVLPAIPACALLTSCLWHRFREHWLVRGAALVTIGIFILLFVSQGALLRVSGGAAAAVLLAGGMACAVAAIQGLARRELPRALHAFSVLAAVLILVAPRFTFEALPPEAIPFMGASKLPAGVVRRQIYLYSWFLDRRAEQLTRGDEMKAMLERGGRIIVTQSDLEEFKATTEALPPVRELFRWEAWKEQVKSPQVIRALVTGDTSPLREPVFIVARATAP